MKIICLTSNDYVNILPGFAYLFNKFYPNQQVEVVRYDVRPPKLPDNFKQFAIGKQSDYSWSGGLRYYLSQIEDEHVLLMLEDYYLDKPVNQSVIGMAKTMMITYENIVKFDLTDDRSKVENTLYTDHYFKENEQDLHEKTLIKSSVNAPFLASVQAAIWRRDFLINILNSKESAWQFEKNKRTKEYLKKNNGIILGCFNEGYGFPMSYVNAVGGMGNNPGKYDLKKIPSWMIDELKANKVWSNNG